MLNLLNHCSGLCSKLFQQAQATPSPSFGILFLIATYVKERDHFRKSYLPVWSASYAFENSCVITKHSMRLSPVFKACYWYISKGKWFHLHCSLPDSFCLSIKSFLPTSNLSTRLKLLGMCITEYPFTYTSAGTRRVLNSNGPKGFFGCFVLFCFVLSNKHLERKSSGNENLML